MTPSEQPYNEDRVAFVIFLKGHERMVKPGLGKIYACWLSMKYRCTSPKSTCWKYYGGRGIRFSAEWRRFENFYIDIGQYWEPGLTLDRIDVNGDYKKGNCQWATRWVQAQNKRVYKNNRTGEKGVSMRRGNRYHAAAVVNGKQTHLGNYPKTPEGLRAAAEAVKKARQLAEIIS